ncbi:MAG: hypothetical protein AAF517_06795 [Planctomycetota bacterium]
MVVKRIAWIAWFSICVQLVAGDAKFVLDGYDPLAKARASVGKSNNLEASVPPQCYTKTGGDSNPCWVCHADPKEPNYLKDWRLQEEYAFSDFALKNRWKNLFVDRSAQMDRISDQQILEYIREDNYLPLVAALKKDERYPGFVPDLDFNQGFDSEGFAQDGSGWRALRYKPFLGTFWPSNGSTDDVMIRLPKMFRLDASGKPSREIYRINFAILEAAICASPDVPVAKSERKVEDIDESVAGVDLDGDGSIGGKISRIRGLPKFYVGGAAKKKVKRHLYPGGTEYLHSVRYVDPDAPNLISNRMKELRYSIKRYELENWARLQAYSSELEEKDEGKTPVFRGQPEVGLMNQFGWQLQGFIEDHRGRLRLQTEEEHRFCMGCHSAIGVTVDHTFTLARKVPGADGWRYQDLRGMKDVPQLGHKDPEVLTYFRRVRGGDEFRANEEMLSRFFDKEGNVDEKLVRRASPGGDLDLGFLLAPSRGRALQLGKAYLTIVRDQSFVYGRDAIIAPPENVHRRIKNGSTDLGRAKKVFRDGRLWLNWNSKPKNEKLGAVPPQSGISSGSE